MIRLKIPHSLFYFLAICTGIIFILTACNGAALEEVPQPAGPSTGGETSQEDAPPILLTEVEAPFLVSVRTGEFNMGSSDEDLNAREDEFPQHRLRMNGFLIYSQEVTNLMYQQCVADEGCSPPAIDEDGPSKFYLDPLYGDNPLVGVDWFQARAYCQWANARLPTEAEWEYTARANTEFLYPWGDQTPDYEKANFGGLNNERFPEEPQTDDVDLHKPGESPWEARDMAGNVMEWVADWYDPAYYEISPPANPQGPGDDKGLTEKVVRGGGWNSSPEDLRAAARFALDPLSTRDDLGFRCIPLGEKRARAPFCVDSGVPFCVPPGRPGDGPGDEECEPLTPPTLRVGVGCRDENGQLDVIVHSDAHADDVSAMFGNNAYNCVQFEEGVMVCSGPAQTEGLNWTFELCVTANGQSGAAPGPPQLVTYNAAAAPPQNTLIAFNPNPSPANILVTYNSQRALYGGGEYDPRCPNGGIFNEDTGLCERGEEDDLCPEGWVFTNVSPYVCQPDDPGDCPEGTTFVMTDRGGFCEPGDNRDCPEGWTFDVRTESCLPPDSGDGEFCAEGYAFDQDANCCVPVPGDNYDCEEGYYFAAAYDRCWPITRDGCEPGYFYTHRQGCVPEEPGDNDEDCPPFTAVANFAGVDHCVPEEEGRAEGAVGYLPDQEEPPCRDGHERDENGNCGSPDDGSSSYDRCIAIGGVWIDGRCYTGGDCGPGYAVSALMEICMPDDGPGSPCPQGATYHPRYECCVPDHGSFCPEDEQIFLDYLPAPQTLAAAAPVFNDGRNCYPGDDPDECIEGYTRNGEICEENGTVPDCGERAYWDQEIKECIPFDMFGCRLDEAWNGQIDRKSVV